MKVLIVNAYRDRGSTGKIISELGSYLTDQDVEVLYAYRDGPVYKSKETSKTDCKIGKHIETALTYRLNYLFGSPYTGAFLSTLRLIKLLKQEKPDVISLHSINGSYINIPILIRWIKRHHIAATITHHSEYLYTGNCTYAYDCLKWKTGCNNCNRLKDGHISLIFDTSSHNYRVMKNAFKGAKNILSISVSPWVSVRARESSIISDLPQITILNGINEKIFFPHIDPDFSFRRRFAEDNKKVLLYSTAKFSDSRNDIKGGRYIIELAKRPKFLNCVFLVACLSCDIKGNLPANIINLGPIIDQEYLARLYSCADVLILTSTCETYSMPTAEALMCGTPVVGFRAGGPESIALPQYCYFVEHGNIEELSDALYEVIDKGFRREEIAMHAKKKYGSVQMCESYLQAIYKLTNKETRN